MKQSLVIADPVHQVMNFGSDTEFRAMFREVLDARPVQRLRQISQLGLAALVFPGATHSRFLHALGTAYLAARVLEHLEEREEANGDGIREHRRPVILAALLHDVGHGPFSHSFEHVLRKLALGPDAPARGDRLPPGFRPPLHEDWSYAIIGSRDSELYPLLEKRGIDPAQVAAPFAPDDRGRRRLPHCLRQIVSSQLDVDRMDYLVRDSHFAGVAAGRVDIHYLINTLALVHHGHGAPTLGLQPKGIKAYEGFALARQFMNRTLYYHKAVKVFEFMMEELLRRVVLARAELERVPELAGAVPEYLRAVGDLVGASGAPAMDQFIAAHMRSYIRMAEPAIWHLVTTIADAADRGLPAHIGELARSLVSRRQLPAYRVASGGESVVEQNLADAGFVPDEDFAIVDLRTTVYKESGERVYVGLDGGRVDDILDRSEILSLMRNREESESVLIVLDRPKADAIRSVAERCGALEPE